jgi:DNA processing protein
MDSIEIPHTDLPPQLAEIPHPPKMLFCRGVPPARDGKYLVVVGSRNHSVYAQEACKKILSELAGTDIYIVSGLALGIDTVAHETALSVGLKTIAFPGSGLDRSVLYPASNFSLAERIVQNGGALLSEFPENFKATPWGFPKRNRLMAGIAHTVLVVEATEKSGTLITARMALDYNRDVAAVPGDITRTHSQATNALIRQGAVPITCGDDILELFGVQRSETKEKPTDSLSPHQKEILELIQQNKTTEEIYSLFSGTVSECTIALTMLEIDGYDLPKKSFNGTN